MSKHHFRKTVDSSERKLSVFERLGTKSGEYKTDNAVCTYWAADEFCPLGRSCKLAHTHLAGATSKYTKEGSMKKRGTVPKKLKNHRASSIDTTPLAMWDKWDFGDLEGADEKDLQKRRLQLQRELELQMKKEKGIGKKKKKKGEKVTRSPSTSSSTTSDTSSSASSSSVSSVHSKKRVDRKRKPSPSSDSDDSPRRKKKKTTKSSPKLKVVVKKKMDSPRKASTSKKTSLLRKSTSPVWERRTSPTKRKSPARVKPRATSPKHKTKEISPRRIVKSKERRASPPRPARLRSAERRRHHSPRRRRESDRGGLEKGGKILPVKSSAYMKEMKETVRRKSAERLRIEKEKEREKDKRRREQKVRETERKERERETERIRREADRQKERQEIVERVRERPRERERTERIDRDKRIKDFDRKELDSRKPEAKSDLPSLLDIKTEAPREAGPRTWDERRPRRTEENFEFRRVQREEHEPCEGRRTRKVHEYLHEPVTWEGGDEFREPPPTTDWPRDWKPRYEQKWSGEGSREGSWRDQYSHRRPDWHTDGAPPEEQPLIEERPPADIPRRPPEPLPVESSQTQENPPTEIHGDLEEALSDISDDADDILNQVDEPPSSELVDTHSNQPPPCLNQPNLDFIFDHRRPLLECFGERGLDFEEISDEELEEEARMSKGIMDVLGADWASLIKQTPAKSPKVDSNNSALRRWRVDSVIARIGISKNILGDDRADSFISRIKKQCADEDKRVNVKTESTTDSETIKKEVNDEELVENRDDSVDRVQGISVKKEESEETEKEELALRQLKLENGEGVKTEDFMTLLHPIPAIHATLYETAGQSAVQRLLRSRFKQALSARTDLAVRRVLCGFGTKEPVHIAGCDPLYENSIALFKSAVA